MTSAAPSGSELLLVTIGGRAFGLPVEVVREVLFLEGATLDARSLWRGEQVAVLDLAPGPGDGPPAAGDRLVVIEVEGERCALRVAAVEGLHALPVQLSAALADPAAEPSNLVSAVALHEGAQVALLDPEAVVALANASARGPPEGGEHTPNVPEATPQTELLAMGSRGRSWAVPLAAVEGIVELGSLATVPRAPPFVRGLVNFRGEILLAVDVAELLEPGRPGFADLRHVVAVCVGGRRLALLVERTFDVFVAPLESFLPGAHAALPKPADMAEGATTFLEPAALVDHVFGQLGGAG